MDVIPPGPTLPTAVLAPIVGRVLDVERLATKAKSSVLVVRGTARTVVAKTAAPHLLAHERLVHDTVLPRLGLTAAAVLAVVEHGGRTWSIATHVDGRRPDPHDPEDRDALGRWVARLHERSRALLASLPAPLGGRPTPTARLDLLDAALRSREEDRATRDRLLDASAEVRAALTGLVPDAAAAVPDAFAHADLAPQNLLVTVEGVVALDWERSGVRNPTIDLAAVDLEPYRDELAALGRPTDAEAMRRARLAATVLAALEHDLARKSLAKQGRYLDRMLRCVRALADGSGAPR